MNVSVIESVFSRQKLGPRRGGHTAWRAYLQLFSSNWRCLSWVINIQKSFEKLLDQFIQGEWQIPGRKSRLESTSSLKKLSHPWNLKFSNGLSSHWIRFVLFFVFVFVYVFGSDLFVGFVWFALMGNNWKR